jgi:hypothetical protein
MIKLVLVFCLSFACIAAVRSQDTTSMDRPQDQMREQIEVRDLPEVIRTSLQGQDYMGWTVTAAYKGHMPDPSDPLAPYKEIYIIDLKSGVKTTTVSFDKDGNRLDKMKREDKK